MQKVVNAYENLPWLTKNPHENRKRVFYRCNPNGCSCDSFAQCYENAKAYIAAATYFKTFKPPVVECSHDWNSINNGKVHHKCHAFKKYKCGSKEAKHQVFKFSHL